MTQKYLRYYWISAEKVSAREDNQSEAGDYITSLGINSGL